MGGEYLFFQLNEVEGRIPLGWSLSDAARQLMDKQLNTYLDNLKPLADGMPVKKWWSEELKKWAVDNTTKSCKEGDTISPLSEMSEHPASPAL
jgi:hypothetical protein